MPTAKDILYENFIKGCNYLLEKDKQRLRDQGHYVTGRLERSLNVKAYFKDGKLIADFFMKQYGVDLDTGLKPSQIFSRPQDLKEWARLVKPGLSESELNSFAYNTWRKHKTEGMPTKASLRFSKTGERTKWIKRGSELAEREFDDIFQITAFLLSLVNEIGEAA